MHVATTRRQHKDKVYETHLLRRSYREDGKVKNETLANLSHLPAQTIQLIRESLAGKAHVVAGEGFDIERSVPHGHVALLWAMAEQLDLAKVLGPPCPERDLALSLVLARCAKPASKLATGVPPVDRTPVSMPLAGVSRTLRTLLATHSQESCGAVRYYTT